MSVFEVGRILWEARKREAWGAYADTIMARTPWPRHIADPDMAADHMLAIAEAKALLSKASVSLKEMAA